jgi:hypothetical protein
MPAPGERRDRHALPNAALAVALLLPILIPAPAAADDAAAARAPRRRVAVDPEGLVSREAMLATLGELTAIGADGFYRTAASRGEAEALDWLEARLRALPFLATLGGSIERQSFRLLIGQDAWQARLTLTVGGGEHDVPAHALAPHREILAPAMHFDSDGALNDTRRDPVTVSGPVTALATIAQVNALTPGSLRGRLALVDYALVDRSVLGRDQAIANLTQLLTRQPSGIVLVTQLSDVQGESHGAFVGDLGALTLYDGGSLPPTLYVRLEDLEPLGIANWAALGAVQSARLVWDADVYSPGTSGNLLLTIPGADRSRAVILGAHIDSPNSPGALDDGSGTVALLETARVLDQARVRPPVDLALVWFGSEERGLYGSYVFAGSHDDLLDRALAMLQVDCLARPLDGIVANLHTVAWPYGRFGDPRMPWGDYLRQLAADRGITTVPFAYYGVEADNTAFQAFDVPNVNLIYQDPYAMQAAGFHYNAHVHDPYETVEAAAAVGETLEAMARVALAAALRTGRDIPVLRVTPSPTRQALLVASHTEPALMAAAGWSELGMALAWEGFDVDAVPFGTAVTPAHLAGADLVIALPVVDFGEPDEGWSTGESQALAEHVAAGGRLVIAASAYRLRLSNVRYEPNEDVLDINTLASRFGVTYGSGTIAAATATPVATHALVQGVTTLELAAGNGVPFTATGGQVLARAGSQAVLALAGTGSRVVVLADAGMLGTAQNTSVNLQLWRNLARWAATP